MNPAVDAATDVLLERGVRVLNAFLLGETELAHVLALLHLMDAPQGATVLDMGCGVGEIPRLMQAQRPDLTFILQNVSQAQLAHCPDGMRKVLGDFAATGLEDASVDVVMFNYSLCHSGNWHEAIAEANRVLREGGILFVNDFARAYPDDSTMLRRYLGAWAFTPEQVDETMRIEGFIGFGTAFPPAAWPLRDTFENRGLYDAIAEGLAPGIYRYLKSTDPDPIRGAFSRHTRIGFQFSGGRDSTAALYELRPFWHLMTVYHLNTGDQFPELQEVVQRVAQDVPIVVIEGNVELVRAQHGLPSDLVPVDNSRIGIMVSGEQLKIQSRFDCCGRALMTPMLDRMRADGITLVIRGQRNDEYARPPMRSGQMADGIEVLYPIETWTAQDVDNYLDKSSLPVAPFYSRGMTRAPECMGCTAWWDEGRAKYLKQYHPVKFAAYEQDIALVDGAIRRQYNILKGK